jgi:hypothetical protein
MSLLLTNNEMNRKSEMVKVGVVVVEIKVGDRGQARCYNSEGAVVAVFPPKTTLRLMKKLTFRTEAREEVSCEANTKRYILLP